MVQFLTRLASTSVPCQTIEPLVSQIVVDEWLKGLLVNILVERHVLRHSYRALAHARANVYAPARLYVPMLATTLPRWGTRWEVVRFNRAGCMPSEDVVLPVRSMVTFAFSSVGKIDALLLPDVSCVHACFLQHKLN